MYSMQNDNKKNLNFFDFVYILKCHEAKSFTARFSEYITFLFKIES